MQNLRVVQGVPVERVRAAPIEPPLDLSDDQNARDSLTTSASVAAEFAAAEALAPAHPLASPVSVPVRNEY